MTLPGTDDEAAWLRRFHAGDRDVLERCYRDHFRKVANAAGRVLGVVDAETVTHEVFYRLLSDRSVREGFRGGNVGAWLAQIASNAAIDAVRRRRREVEPEAAEAAAVRDGAVDPSRVDEEVEAKMLVERFKERLPEKWLPLFEARFLRQLPQRDAAKELGMQRSTLAYQEQKIRELLESFLIEGEGT